MSADALPLPIKDVPGIPLVVDGLERLRVTKVEPEKKHMASPSLPRVVATAGLSLDRCWPVVVGTASTGDGT
jgi:hypothetical protein